MNHARELFRISAVLLIVLCTAILATAQVASQPAATPASSSQAIPATQPLPSPADMAADVSAANGLLRELNDWALKTTADLGRIRTDKWKADRAVKEQGQSNVDSLQRNLTSALPQFIAQVQSAPQLLNPNLKLYRNLNALYDVLVTVGETAGAFGPKDVYGPLADDAGTLDSIRRQVADRLDWLAGVRDNEVGVLRQQLQLARAAAIPPKKVTDETPPPPKKPAKKSAKKPAKAPAAQ